VRRWATLAAVVLGLVAGAPVASASAAEAAVSTRLVVVGAPGLSWSDVEGGDLPAVRAMAAEGAVGSMTVRAVRSRSCAVDGWLTVSAGRRAADVAGPCREPLPVVADRVPRWDEYLAAAAAGSYDAHPGTLAEGVTASAACVETVGPGAAIGGAEPTGVVTTYGTSLPASFSCPVVLVDGGTLPESGPQRAAALGLLDALVAQVRAVDDGADVIVAGVGDGLSPVRPRAVVASGPSYERGLLTSASTRQPGLVQLQDLTATALTRVGASDAEVTGRPLTVSASTGSAAAVLADRVGFETRAATLRAVSPQVTLWLAVGYALWALVVAVLWWWRRAGVGSSPGGEFEPVPGSVPSWLRLAGMAVATVPVSTFVANLVPWWRAGEPVAVFLVAVGGVVALLTAVAWWTERTSTLGALRAIAVVTLLVLGGDVFSGSGLQLGSVFGQNPIIGGRFYGLGNTSFALYGLAVLVVVGWVAASGRSRGLSRSLSAGLAAVVLVVALAVEALPAWGADFGGPPGLLLGGLVVIASAAGVRLTWGRVLVAVVVAAALAAVVAVLDWLRPAESRTHLGEFVQSVVSGEARAVVGRKLAQNVANLESPPLLAIAVATVVLVVVAWRVGWRPVDAGAAVLRGAAVMAVVAFLVNDSGLVIPAFVALVLAPLLVAAGAAGPADSSRRNLHLRTGKEVART